MEQYVLLLSVYTDSKHNFVPNSYNNKAGLSLLMGCPEQLEQLLISVYYVTSHNAKWTTSKALKLQFRKSKFKPLVDLISLM